MSPCVQCKSDGLPEALGLHGFVNHFATNNYFTIFESSLAIECIVCSKKLPKSGLQTKALQSGEGLPVTPERLVSPLLGARLPAPSPPRPRPQRKASVCAATFAVLSRLIFSRYLSIFS